jgi:hypothetical protein
MKLRNHYYEIFLEIFIDLVKSQINVFQTILCTAQFNLTYLKVPNPTAHQFTSLQTRLHHFMKCAIFFQGTR